MCGIIGYIGKNDARNVILEGLKTLEYRGYDSSGIAVLKNKEIRVVKSKGKIVQLEKKLKEEPIVSNIGIGHTRWATHGKPNGLNAHPHHIDNIVLIHNGIIENYHSIKQKMIDNGRKFISETDTEVAAHLVAYNYQKSKNIKEAILQSVNQLEGSFSLGIICQDYPNKIFGVKNGSPLIVGHHPEHTLFASDIPALVRYTDEIYHMEDLEITEISRETISFYDFEGQTINKSPHKMQWTPVNIEKGGYKHYMLKEIFEQPTALANNISTRIFKDTGTLNIKETGINEIDLKQIKKIHIIACGTSWHAGLIGKFLIEKITRIPVEVDLASEYRYRSPLIDKETILIPISQSGETADTLASLKLACSKDMPSIAIVNAFESSISRLANAAFYTLAGPEIGVASTKAFTTQILTLYQLALAIAQEMKILSSEELNAKLQDIVTLPSLVEKTLSLSGDIEKLSSIYQSINSFMFIGRGINYPIALEGALKLKEISYIHAEGYPAGELKHGPIALIDEVMPTVAICLKDHVYTKTFSNIEEIHARGGKLIIIATEGDESFNQITDHVFYLPKVSWELSPILASIPLQLLAYYIANLKGTDIDQPRNLAKSVTVE